MSADGGAAGAADEAEVEAVEGDNEFVIPELPHGRTLRFELLGPWDDAKFMGLNAIEMFATNGTRPHVEKIETNAAETFGELENLLFCTTCPSTDARGMWMCAYEADKLPVTITMHLSQPETLAIIRVWNYSESRVHALRGVHRLRIFLDDRCIFLGEITCAFSDLDGKPMGDTILFTTNDEILQVVAENDLNFRAADDAHSTCSQMDMLSIEPTSSTNASSISPSPLTDMSIQRPQTGGASSTGSAERANSAQPLALPVPTAPLVTVECESDKSETEDDDEEEEEDGFDETDLVDGIADDRLDNCVKGKLFHMELSANWGAPDLIGLTGIQFLGPTGEPISTAGCIVRCSTELSHEEASKLLNGKNLTCRPEDMWLTAWDPQKSPPLLSFAFKEEVELSGVSIWNYNASQELACAGARCAQFYIDGRPIVNAVLLRKAPGYVFFDYVQDVMFDRCHLFRPLTSRPSTKSISAFIFQIRLLSTWGDEFYIGLNGIELYNRRNHLIKLRPQNLAAFPESVNILPTVEKDPRSSDKLIDGVNDTANARHMWLTPVLPNSYARLFLIFDTPTFISRICIYNYRKTAARGVRHIAISADDLIIYSGEVPQSTPSETGILDISLREIED
ncbi:hypothetical protein M3Y99_01008200 [Aphelenchoides fujianensis]|nr:hypothetical protein M3Y99_01008200 [Aphelenchoides fujianensis]